MPDLGHQLGWWKHELGARNAGGGAGFSEGGRRGENISLILDQSTYSFPVFAEFPSSIKCCMRCWGYSNKQVRLSFYFLGAYVLVKKTDIEQTIYNDNRDRNISEEKHQAL